MDGGLYIAVFYLSEEQFLSVGRLGKYTFKPGYYFYVGSAKKNLSSRLKRHSLKEKPLKWHIDYLSVKAKMLGAVIIEDQERKECEIAAEMAQLFSRPAADFGSSDCRCSGHLFFHENFQIF